ncbi:MAG: hypothetical protein WC628_02745 [Candidatus Omnitrophota bacterium]
MQKANQKLFFITILFLFVFSSLQCCLADILESWNNPKAYQPKPVLFLHGFGKGNSLSWSYAKSSLSKYFNKYSSSYAYLEAIDFSDPNGSVDTYDTGKRNPEGNSDGWADKTEDKINELLSVNKYGAYSNKINLVCHSMGGLAARWYLANHNYNYVDKLILIGVPNKGSNLANVANVFTKLPTLGWLTYLGVSDYFSKFREGTDSFFENMLEADMHGEAVDDMDPKISGSGFIDKLNSLSQSPNISYYAIIGKKGHLLNWIVGQNYDGGDSVVSIDSQIGTNIVPLKASAIISALHWDETKIAAQENDNKILKFLDSDKPELEITSPVPTKVTEIFENSVHIQGKVYKEYLPADSKLNLTITRQGDGYVMPVQSSLIKPSGLWIPNNPDSPVAEFDEIINFSGAGTYKISCQIENPAGIHSETKEILVKVNVIPGTNIIVHCHNPEGKEIASISGMSQNCVEIFDGNAAIGYSAYNPETHNRAKAISVGTHTIKAKFNGITKEQNINLNPNETKVLTFIFTRTSIAATTLFNLSGSYSNTDRFEMRGSDVSEWRWVFWSPFSSSSIHATHYITYHIYYRTLFMGTYETTMGFSLTPNKFSWDFHGYADITGTLPDTGGVYIDNSGGRLMVNKDISSLFSNQFIFNNWYAQCSVQNSFKFCLVTSTGSMFYLPSHSSSLSICPNQPYVTLQSDLIMSSDSWAGSPPAHLSYGSDIYFNYNDLKFSSVPYDLDGRAI